MASSDSLVTETFLSPQILNVAPEEIKPLVSRLQKLYDDRTRVETDARIGRVAAQVSHDIRSPLAALEMVLTQLSVLPEEQRIIIRSAISRIKDIANNLNSQNKSSKGKEGANEPIESQLLYSLLDTLITEKRLQFRSRLGIQIELKLSSLAYGFFARIQTNTLKRVISNLVNNSVEAVGNSGKVIISLENTSDNQIQIKVEDNGKGIPPEVLIDLGQRGKTYGKAGGSELGLYHAYTSVESWGGQIEIQSKIDNGTTVIITLPKAPAEKWFVDELLIAQHSYLVILDDDESIHRIWEGRTDSARFVDSGIQLIHHSCPVRDPTQGKRVEELADIV